MHIQKHTIVLNLVCIDISVYGKPVYLTLIARRSSYYAGARFLKRGADSNVSGWTLKLVGGL